MLADVMVIGGGPAGLSAALHLARYGRSVVVFDVQGGRSAFRQVNRNYLGFPDGIAITDLVAQGQEQLSRYSEVSTVDQRVEAVERSDAGFSAHGWSSRAVVLATGVEDSYPHFDGWEHCVGVSVFWCIACDGWESRGKTIVVTGNDDHAALEALQLRRLSDDVTLVTNADTDDLSPELRQRLARHSVAVVHERVDAADHTEGQLRALRLAGGERLPVDALFSAQGITPQSEVARLLGVSRREDGYVTVDSELRTDVAGVVAAGDVTSLHSHAVTTAVYEGSQAAATAHHDLLPDELQ